MLYISICVFLLLKRRDDIRSPWWTGGYPHARNLCMEFAFLFHFLHLYYASDLVSLFLLSLFCLVLSQRVEHG